jgi:segregation and condensation protein B
MARAGKNCSELDRELEDLPPAQRWREWMGRVEAALFASARPVVREDLARVVGANCSIELILDDIRDELRGRPYEIVAVAGGWSFRTRLGFGEAIRAALGGPTKSELSKPNAVVLMAIAYFQPITRGELSQLLGREVSRDAIAALREQDLIAAGPRSPTPGAPFAYVTTPGFLGEFGFESLRDLPDIETLADAGLLGRTGAGASAGDALAAELREVLGLSAEEDAPEEDAADGPMSVSPARLVAISL